MEFNDDLRNLLKVLQNAAESNGQQTERASVNKFRKFVDLFTGKGYQMKLITVFSNFYESNKDDLNKVIGSDDVLNDEVIAKKEIISHSAAKSPVLPIGRIYMKSTNKVKLKIIFFLYSVLSNSVNDNEDLLAVIANVEGQLEDESPEKQTPFDLGNITKQISDITEKSFGQKFDAKSLQDTVSNLLGKDSLDGIMKSVEKSSNDFKEGKPLAEVFTGIVGQLQTVMDSSGMAQGTGGSVSSQTPMIEDASNETNE